MHFHRDVLAIADTFGAHLVRAGPDDVFTGTPPLAFTFGLGGLLVFPLRVGASVLLIEKATPVQLAEAVERHRGDGAVHRAHRPTGRCCGPAASGSCASLRRAVSAGEHLPAGRVGGVPRRAPGSG